MYVSVSGQCCVSCVHVCGIIHHVRLQSVHMWFNIVPLRYYNCVMHGQLLEGTVNTGSVGDFLWHLE